MKLFCFLVSILIFLCSCGSKEYINCQTIYEIENSSMSRAEKYLNSDTEYKKLLGKTIYNSKLEPLSGDMTDMYAVAGKVTVINFWFTTCPPCNKEIPHLNKLKKIYEGKPVSFISIADNTREELEKFLESNEFDWPVYLQNDINYEYCIGGYPTTIIVDQEMQVVKYQSGLSTDVESYFQELRTKIDELLI